MRFSGLLELCRAIKGEVLPRALVWLKGLLRSVKARVFSGRIDLIQRFFPGYLNVYLLCFAGRPSRSLCYGTRPPKWNLLCQGFYSIDGWTPTETILWKVIIGRRLLFYCWNIACKQDQYNNLKFIWDCWWNVRDLSIPSVDNQWSKQIYSSIDTVQLVKASMCSWFS